MESSRKKSLVDDISSRNPTSEKNTIGHQLKGANPKTATDPRRKEQSSLNILLLANND